MPLLPTWTHTQTHTHPHNTHTHNHTHIHTLIHKHTQAPGILTDKTMDDECISILINDQQIYPFCRLKLPDKNVAVYSALAKWG